MIIENTEENGLFSKNNSIFGNWFENYGSYKTCKPPRIIDENLLKYIAGFKDTF